MGPQHAGWGKWFLNQLQKVRTFPSMIMSETLSTLSSQSAAIASASDFHLDRLGLVSASGRTICTDALRGSETGFPIWDRSLTLW